MTEPSPDDMKDPSNWAIYSPESSDDQRFGDWQTKLVASIFVIIACGIAMYGVGKASQHYGKPAWWEFSAHSEEAPKQTNKERGMLNLNEAFGPQPKIRLCEVIEDGKVRLRDCAKVKNDKHKM